MFIKGGRINFREKSQKETFCLYPFVHMNHKVDGKTAPCFRSLPTGDINEQESGWNSEALKKLRRDLCSNKKNEICRSCWHLEDSGVTSYRQNSLRDVEPFHPWQRVVENYEESTGRMKQGPKQIELRFSNECNFQCRMCGPLFSSKWEQELESNVDTVNVLKEVGISYNRHQISDIKNKESLYQKLILKNIDEWSESIEYIMIAGGEPLIQPQHLEMLQALEKNADKMTLEYTTNLSTLRFRGIDMVEKWQKFKGLFLKVSVDGDRLTYPYVRKFANIERLQKNCQRVLNELDLEKVKFVGTLTTSVYNIARAVEAVEFFTELGLLFHTSQVQYPNVLSTQILPVEEKREITARTNHFLDHLEEKLQPLFNSNPGWKDSRRRKDQLKRVSHYLKQSLNFMNAHDKFSLFQDFLKYDKTLNKGENKIFQIYGNWENYVRQ